MLYVYLYRIMVHAILLILLLRTLGRIVYIPPIPPEVFGVFGLLYAVVMQILTLYLSERRSELLFEYKEFAKQLADENLYLRKILANNLENIRGVDLSELQEWLERSDELEAKIEELQERAEALRSLRPGRPKGSTAVPKPELEKLMRSLEYWVSNGGTMREFAERNGIAYQTLRRYWKEWQERISEQIIGRTD